MLWVQFCDWYFSGWTEFLVRITRTLWLSPAGPVPAETAKARFVPRLNMWKPFDTGREVGFPDSFGETRCFQVLDSAQGIVKKRVRGSGPS